MEVKKSIKSVLRVISIKKYFVITILTAIILYSLAILSRNYQAIFALSRKLTFFEFSKFIFALLKGSFTENPRSSTLMLVIITILLGVTLALMLFKKNATGSIRGNVTKSGATGIGLGVLLPICAPCGIGLLTLIGFGGIVATLPFQGNELGVLSIGFLSYSALVVGNGIENCKTCQITLKK